MKKQNLKYKINFNENKIIKGQITNIKQQSLQIIFQNILSQQNLTSQYSNFIISSPSSNQQYINGNIDQINIIEKKFTISSIFSSKFEDISLIQVSDNNKIYLEQQPQKPPYVCGKVEKCSIFPCFTSKRTMFLKITDIILYTIKKPELIKKTINLSQILTIKTYRKKSYYFLQLELDNKQILDFKFTKSNILIEWINYIQESIKYNKYLNQKKLYSRAQSYRNFIKNMRQNQTNIIYLDDQEIQLNLPKMQQKEINNISPTFDTKFSDFKCTHKIGSGATSVVFKATKNGELYALKQINKTKMLRNHLMKIPMTELSILIQAQECPFIVPLKYAFQTRDNLYLALKYIKSGSLSYLLNCRKKLQIQQAKLILAQVALAIKFLHDKNILYRDMKPENILIDEEGHAYLIDFGLSKELQQNQEEAASFVGTYLYMAPEKFSDTGTVNKSSDIYGLGCILYEMLHGKRPFEGSNCEDIIYSIKNYKPEIDQLLPRNIKSFLNLTLDKNPVKRLQHPLQHEIFKHINWNKLKNRNSCNFKDKVKDIFSNQIQINSNIDEDYNQLTYPQNKIRGWYYDFSKIDRRSSQ